MAGSAPRRRIELDTPDMVWRVAEGDAWIVLEPAPDSGLPRSALAVARIPAGGYAFGLAASKDMPQIRVFLETSVNTRLVPIMAEQFVGNCRARPKHAMRVVMPLVRQLAAFLSPEVPPARVEKMLRPRKNIRLPAGFQVSALENIWVRPETGVCRYGGLEMLGHLDKEQFFPLLGNQWVEVVEASRLICVDTLSVIRSGLFFDSVVRLGNMVLQAAFEIFSEQELNQFMRLVRSSRHRKAEFSKAVGQAAKVLESEGSEGEAFASPVAEAVRLVAREMGMRIEQPPRVADGLENQLEDVLAQNGMFSREVTLSGRWQERDSGPLLGFVDREGGADPAPIALLFGRKGYRAVDPEQEKPLEIEGGFAESIKDTALQLYRPLPKGKPGPLALLKYAFGGCGWELLVVALMGLLGGLCGFAIPMAMSTTVDTVIANGDNALLWQIVLGLIMIVFGSAAFEVTKGFALLRAETRGQVTLQSGILGRLLQLPKAFFSKFAAGDLANRVMAVDGIRQQLSSAMQVTLLSSLFALTNIVLLLVYAWQLAIAVLGVLAVTLAVTWMIMRRQMRVQSKMQDVIGQMAGLELQLVTGINKLRAAGAESNAFAKWMENFTELRKIAYSIGMGTNVVMVYTAVLPLFLSLAVFALFTLSGLFQVVSIGGFLAFNSALGQISAAFASLCMVGVSLIFVGPMYRRALPILEATPEINAALEDPGELRGRVSVSNVSFAYENAREPALRGVSLEAKPGEFVAIVGLSGSGKSTLLKLLLGFHRPNVGSILYDGRDLSRLNPVKVRRQIGSVIQNGELIQGNIFFNIMGASTKADEDAAWDAARIAAVDEDIRDMPMGMHTFVPHGGGTFSGGQKQRLMIARAVARKPKIFLLDEATSNLDNRIQAVIMQNLRRIHATRIVVAHRLSTIEKADRIYVMQEGRIIESGNFEELMEQEGVFAKLAARQVAKAGEESR